MSFHLITYARRLVLGKPRVKLTHIQIAISKFEKIAIFMCVYLALGFPSTSQSVNH